MPVRVLLVQGEGVRACSRANNEDARAVRQQGVQERGGALVDDAVAGDGNGDFLVVAIGVCGAEVLAHGVFRLWVMGGFTYA